MRIFGRQIRSSELFMFFFMYLVANYVVIKIQQRRHSVVLRAAEYDTSGHLVDTSQNGPDNSEHQQPGVQNDQPPPAKPIASPVVKGGLAGVDDLDLATDVPPHEETNWVFKDEQGNVVDVQPKGVVDDANNLPPEVNYDDYTESENDDTGKPRLKTILFWNTFFTAPDFRFGFGHQPFLEAKCPVHTCRTTNDRKQVEKADAIVFHGPRIEDFPPVVRRPGQIYVYIQQEPHYSMSSEELPAFQGFFNLTITHRTDSDIQIPYGRVVYDEASIKPKPIHVNPKSRHKTVVWAVSHCSTPSRREWYMKELQKYIDIDVYGACGDMECSKDDYLYCFSKFEKEYRFYVAMENNYCKDYISEKVYRALLYKMVPIVFGGGNYTYGTPPHSVIDIADFQHPRDLAKYLLYLSNNDKAYNKYFAWKTTGYILEHQRKVIMGDAFCRLCEILHDPNYKYKDYRDLKRWWVNGMCDAYTIPRWRKKMKW
ncbi:hypothetical protein LSH36_167g05045 [Paralvinella palmiformis]|uniref:Fucosyltransferase n=1 Tax=Paralvinella palmiformis TaxID=53620 RepID=A0AAD9N918_9ANNE|nr:hypothetical protein LSH36_167g05045 [Paralvinella palmiformis]